MSNGFMEVEEMLGPQHGDVLGATEKAYDRSLQENLRLTDELALLQKAYRDLFSINTHLTTKVEIAQKRLRTKNLGELYGMGKAGMFRSPQQHLHADVNVPILEGVKHPAEAATILRELDENLKTIERMQTEPAELPSHMVIGVAGEDLKTGETVQADSTTGMFVRSNPPGLGKAMSATDVGDRLTVHLSGNETVESATIGSISKTTITPQEDPVKLREIIRKDRQRKRIAIGDRARMKISLTQSQNANRKHKTKIKRLEDQIRRLENTVDAAVPVYRKMLAAFANGQSSYDGNNEPTEVFMDFKSETINEIRILGEHLRGEHG